MYRRIWNLEIPGVGGSDISYQSGVSASNGVFGASGGPTAPRGGGFAAPAWSNVFGASGACTAPRGGGFAASGAPRLGVEVVVVSLPYPH